MLLFLGTDLTSGLERTSLNVNTKKLLEANKQRCDRCEGVIIDTDEFRKKFPNLAKELDGGEEQKITIDAVRLNPKEGEKASDKSDRYEPAAIDFLRRCDTEDDAIKIIEYLERRGEIDKKYAKSLRAQLLQDGIESFGTKKEPGHYFLK